MATAPDLEVEVSLTLRLSSERDATPARWDWAELLGLSSMESVEVTKQKARPYEPTLPENPTDFDGETYQPAFDEERLGDQMRLVYDALSDGRWHTLAELSATTGAPESSVSARLRDLRKRKFGGFAVETRRAGNSGLYWYRIILPPSG